MICKQKTENQGREKTEKSSNGNALMGGSGGETFTKVFPPVNESESGELGEVLACHYKNKTPLVDFPASQGNTKGSELRQRTNKKRDRFIAYLEGQKVVRKENQQDNGNCDSPTLSYIEHCKAGDSSVFFYSRNRPVDDNDTVIQGLEPKRHDDENNVYVRCFKCGSWRHEGECRRWKNAQDFARIKVALESKGEGWVYMVLTLGKKARSEPELWRIYRDLYFKWDKLRKRSQREFGKIEYIALVEQHRDGIPHINLVIWNRSIFAQCQGDGWKEFRKGWLEPNAVACGYGMRTWVEPIRSQDAIAGYFTKLCSEVAKVNQVPVCAPKNFRRLRASRGLLPGKQESEYTGGMVTKPVEQIGKVAKEVFDGQVKVDCDLVSMPSGEVKEIATKVMVEFEPEEQGKVAEPDG